jgi:molybdenum cofactor cytidylyltransferase
MRPDAATGGPSRAAAVILAAGQASRMGRAKVLLDFRGVPLVRHAALTAIAARYEAVSVVAARPAEAIIDALSGLRVAVVINDRSREGIGTSIAAGVSALPPEMDGMVLMLADQPFVSAAHLAALRTLADARCTIVASRYQGTVGVPAFFARPVFLRLANLNGDQGCKGVIRELSEQALFLDYPNAAIDIDTPGDYQRASALEQTR